MSQENVELARQAFDAFNRRDLDAFLALMDPHVEAVPRLAAMEGGYHGHDGIRRWWHTLLDASPDCKVELVEVRDFGASTMAAELLKVPLADGLELLRLACDVEPARFDLAVPRWHARVCSEQQLSGGVAQLALAAFQVLQNWLSRR